MSNRTREQEIARLKSFAKRTDPNDYLASLVTPEFIDWVRGIIGKDFSPDMLGYMNKHLEEASKAGTELSDTRRQLERAEIRLSNEVQTHLTTIGALEHTTEDLDSAESAIRKLQQFENQDREVERLKGCIHELVEKHSAVCAENLRVRRDITSEFEKVQNLKVRMFDMADRIAELEAQVATAATAQVAA